MATVSYSFWSWTSAGPEPDLLPGGIHYWRFWGGDFDYGDAIMVTAHPLRRRGLALAVENVKIEGDPGGPILTFNVRNVGTGRISWLWTWLWLDR